MLGTGFGVMASAGGAPAYTANAVDYNSTTNYLSRGADFTGATDSSTGIFSGWLRLDGSDGANIRMLAEPAAGNSYVARLADNLIYVSWYDTAVTAGFQFTTVNTYLASSTWLHILASWNTNFTAGNKLSHLYINNVSDKTVVTDSAAAFTIDYTRGDFGVGGIPLLGIQLVDGCMAETYFAPGQYLDFSNPTNRAKFISGGKPVDLGADGSLPTGTAPILYIKNPAASVGTNSGTGGNMTANGSFVACSTTPSA